MSGAHVFKVATRVALFFGATVLSASAANAAVEISTKPTTNMSCAGGVCTPTDKKAVLNVSDLANMLASGDTTVQSGSVAQDIDFDAKLSWTNTSRLMLDSYHSIAFNSPIIVAGTGAMTITTNDGGTNGDFQFLKKGHIEFENVNSHLIINDQVYTLARNVRQIGLALKDTAFVALSDNFDSGDREFKHPPIEDLNGTLEGLGNTIKNLRIHDSTTSENTALISIIAANGSVRDLNLASVNSVGDANSNQLVAALAGKSDGGTVLNIHVSGSIISTGNGDISGGLMGESDGTVRRCSADVTVSASGLGNTAGGLLGVNYEQEAALPGIVSESFSTGSVSVTTVSEGDSASVGGLIGGAGGGNISNSYSLATTSGGGPGGSVEGAFMGNATEGSEFLFMASSSYSTGLIGGTDRAITGGFIGELSSNQYQIDSSYWDIDTTGISKGCGCSGVTGLTDMQLKSGLPVGFDKKVWNESAKLNNGYPYLIANPPPK